MRRLITMLSVVTVVLSGPAEASEAWTEHADSLFASGRFDLAVRYLSAALETVSADAPVRSPWSRLHLEAALRHAMRASNAGRAEQLELRAAHRLADTLAVWIDGRRYQEALDEARRQVEQFERITGPNSLYTPLSLEAAAICETRLQREAVAQATIEDALQRSVALLGDRSPLSAEILNTMAWVERRRGDLSRAEMHQRQALALYGEIVGPEHPDYATCLHNLAVQLDWMGSPVEAEEMAREALALRQRLLGEDDPLVVSSLSSVGVILNSQRRFDEAIAIFRVVVDKLTVQLGPDHPSVAIAMHNLASALDEAGHSEEAEPIHRAALAIDRRTSSSNHRQIAIDLDSLGECLTRLDRREEARRCHLEAIRLRTEASGPEHWLLLPSLLALAQIDLATGRVASAESLLERHAAIFERGRRRVGAGAERGNWIPAPYPLLAAARQQRGEGDAAWNAVERHLARSLLTSVRGGREVARSSDENVREDSLRHALDRTETTVTRLRARARGDSSGFTELELATTELLRVEADWATFFSEMAERYPTSEGDPYPLARVQQALHEDEAIVGWLDVRVLGAGSRTLGYVLRPSGPVRWISIEETGAAERLRAKLGKPMASPLGSTPDSLDPALAEGWNERVAPLLPALSGVKKLIVVPCGPMLGLCLEPLIDEDGTSALDRWEISYAPSATLFAWSRESAHPSDRSSALLVGTPEPPPDSGNAPSWLHMLVSAFRGPDRLAGPLLWVDRELDAVASLLPDADERVGPEASETALQRLAEADSLRRYRILHFACHAEADDRVPGRSALILDAPASREAISFDDFPADGRITAEEVLRGWALDADLVTLSGCATAVGAEVQGEGLLGLSHAFQAVGARSVLASLWRVDDEATYRLMSRFYELWIGSGRRASDALREAKQALRDTRDEDGGRPFLSPRYWASFVLIGEP